MRKNLVARTSGNKAVIQRERERERRIRKKRLKAVRGMVDFSEPKSQRMPHIRRNAKRAMQEEERFMEMQRENEHLVGRLSSIIAREGPVADEPLKSKSLARILSNEEARERERRRIDRENAKLLNRIKRSESEYNLDRMLDDWEDKEEVKKRISGGHWDDDAREEARGRRKGAAAFGSSKRLLMAVDETGSDSEGVGSTGSFKSAPKPAETTATKGRKREAPAGAGGGSGGNGASGGGGASSSPPTDRKVRKSRRKRDTSRSRSPSNVPRPEWNDRTGYDTSPPLRRKPSKRRGRDPPAPRERDRDRDRDAVGAGGGRGGRADADEGPIGSKDRRGKRRGVAPHASELREQFFKGSKRRAKGAGSGAGGGGGGASYPADRPDVSELTRTKEDLEFEATLDQLQHGGSFNKKAPLAGPMGKTEGKRKPRRKGKAKSGSEDSGTALALHARGASDVDDASSEASSVSGSEAAVSGVESGSEAASPAGRSAKSKPSPSSHGGSSGKLRKRRSKRKLHKKGSSRRSIVRGAGEARSGTNSPRRKSAAGNAGPDAGFDRAPSAATSVAGVRITRTVKRQEYNGKVTEIVRQNIEGPLTVLVSDMKGFTRLTRKHGAWHFASLIMVMRSLLRPIIDAGSPVLVLAHADNYHVVFDNPEAAVAVAIAMSEALAAYNKGKAADDQVVLGGIGVASGDSVRTVDDELQGDAAAHAHVLGEDIAEGGAVLLSQDVHTAVAGNTAFVTVQFEPGSAADPNDETRTVTYVQCKPVAGLDAIGVVPPGDVLPYELPEYMSADEREFFALSKARLAESPGSDARGDIDQSIRDKWQSKRYAVLLSGQGFQTVSQRFGLDHMLKVKDVKAAMATSIMGKHGGTVAEDVLFFFDNPVDAFLGIMELRQEITLYNAGKEGQWRLPVDAIGMHFGDVLMVPGSHIHWGDPVNTASKMAEDLGNGSQILMSQLVRDQLIEAPEVQQLLKQGRIKLSEHEGAVSGVQLVYYDVTISAVEETEAQDSAAIRIQAVQRGKVARTRVRAKAEEAAMVSVARDEVASAGMGKDEHQAATRIQAVHRGRKVRKSHSKKRIHRGGSRKPLRKKSSVRSRRRSSVTTQENLAASRIQAVHRGKKVRQRKAQGKLGHKKKSMRKQPAGASGSKGDDDDDEERETYQQTAGAATKIQAVHRGRKARARVGRMRGETDGKDSNSSDVTDAAEDDDGADSYGDDFEGTSLQGSRKLQASDEQDFAATKVQSVWRGRQDRTRTTRIRRERHDVAAAKVQATYRGRAARKKVSELKQTKNKKISNVNAPSDAATAATGGASEEASAAKVQALYRGKRDRVHARMVREEHKAAAQAQALYRGKRDRLKVQEIKEQHQSARKLQAVARGKRDRKRVSALRGGKTSDSRTDQATKAKAEPDDNAAATKLQAAQRGRSQRKKFQQTKAEHQSARKLQAVARGKRDREKVKTIKVEHTSATKVQAVVRGKRDRKRVAEFRGGKTSASPKVTPDDDAAATKLQAVQRGRSQRKKFQQTKNEHQSARKLQAVARGKRDRQKVQEIKEQHTSAAKVQAVARGKRDRKRAADIREGKALDTPKAAEPKAMAGETKDDAAATKLQAAQRGRSQRKKFQQTKAEHLSARKLQAVARGKRDREKVKTIKVEHTSATKVQAVVRGKRDRKRVADLRESKEADAEYDDDDFDDEVATEGKEVRDGAEADDASAGSESKSATSQAVAAEHDAAAASSDSKDAQVQDQASAALTESKSGPSTPDGAEGASQPDASEGKESATDAEPEPVAAASETKTHDDDAANAARIAAVKAEMANLRSNQDDDTDTAPSVEGPEADTSASGADA